MSVGVDKLVCVHVWAKLWIRSWKQNCCCAWQATGVAGLALRGGGKGKGSFRPEKCYHRNWTGLTPACSMDFCAVQPQWLQPYLTQGFPLPPGEDRGHIHELALELYYSSRSVGGLWTKFLTVVWPAVVRYPLLKAARVLLVWVRGNRSLCARQASTNRN